MESVIGVVQAVCIGTSQPFIRPGTFSAISKSAVRAEVTVHYEGLEGDEQADIKVHGGLDKAVHIYPFEHYSEWRDLYRGPHTRFMSHGSFGENLSTLGLTEDNVCIGDILSIGTVILEVTQTRQPCWKVNEKFGIPGLANQMQRLMKTGFYCRVLQPGKMASGHCVELSNRLHPDWPLQRILKLLYSTPLDIRELEQALELPLVPKWRIMFERRLFTKTIEDWTPRLTGPVNYERTL
jgi:MOSC domain-containing protein YiiM